MNAELFTDGHKPWVRAVGKLIVCKNAKDYFIQLEQDATLEGKLYALCGLYYLDYSNYNTYLEKYINDSSEVQWWGSINSIPVKELIKVDGAVRLKNLNETISKWLKRTRTDVMKISLDFYGGGIPESVLYSTGLGLYQTESKYIEIFGFAIEIGNPKRLN